MLKVRTHSTVSHSRGTQDKITKTLHFLFSVVRIIPLSEDYSKVGFKWQCWFGLMDPIPLCSFLWPIVPLSSLPYPPPFSPVCHSPVRQIRGVSCSGIDSWQQATPHPSCLHTSRHLSLLCFAVHDECFAFVWGPNSMAATTRPGYPSLDMTWCITTRHVTSTWLHRVLKCTDWTSSRAGSLLLLSQIPGTCVLWMKCFISQPCLQVLLTHGHTLFVIASWIVINLGPRLFFLSLHHG